MGFSRQGYWSGLPYPPLRDLPDPGIEPTWLTSLALEGEFILTLNLEVGSPGSGHSTSKGPGADVLEELCQGAPVAEAE